MSFSSEIKEELSKLNTLSNKEIVKAELIGYLLSSNIVISNNKIKYSTENEYNINRFNKLLKNLNIDYKIELQGKIYTIKFNKNINIDEICINKDFIEINNLELDSKEENYLKAGVVTDMVQGGRDVSYFNNFTVPENYVFAMGDNRPGSTDCRSFGCIPLEKIEGKVLFRFWPFSKFGGVD